MQLKTEINLFKICSDKLIGLSFLDFSNLGSINTHHNGMNIFYISI